MRTSGARRSRSASAPVSSGRLALVARAAVVGEHAARSRLAMLRQAVAVDHDLGRRVGREHELVDRDVGKDERLDDEDVLRAASSLELVELALEA